MKFLPEIFQDIDGGYSMKRTGFAVLLALFVVIVIAGFFHAIPPGMLSYMQGALDKVTELIKWMGGFIVGEQATKFAPGRKIDCEH